MGQLLRIALVLLALWLILRFIKRALARRRADSPAPPPPADMLRCDYCGVFVPRAEAIAARAKVYCSSDHADADRAKN
jgi:uncharacterized protein